MLFRSRSPEAHFSLPLFSALCASWSDWRRGIPPGREWRGRGAQNGLLLRAYGTLDRALADVQAETSQARPREGREAFEARALESG